MIIAIYAGTGKTTMAKLYPQTVLDFVCMPYKYVMGQEDVDSEACKANPDNIMQVDWPYNYVSAIQSALNNCKLLLIPTDVYVLALLRQENIPYYLCYPQRSAKEIYRKCFVDRGNTEEFIEIFINKWDSFLATFEKDTYGHHIVLKPNQFLADVIKSNDLNLLLH